MDSATDILWSILYNEKIEPIPDPNKPENTAYISAKRRERAQQLKHFMEGSGRILYDQWRDKVKRNVIALLATPETELCKCAACLVVRDTRKYLDLIVEAEQILSAEGISKE